MRVPQCAPDGRTCKHGLLEARVVIRELQVLELNERLQELVNLSPQLPANAVLDLVAEARAINVIRTFIRPRRLLVPGHLGGGDEGEQ